MISMWLTPPETFCARILPEKFELNQKVAIACKNCVQIVKPIYVGHPPYLLAMSFKTTNY